ncbi:MAG: FHA domain-containing protein [Anaerolineales bacterium]|nr:FHA domain-containing protein [Anaerolineales bacterium]
MLKFSRQIVVLVILCLMFVFSQTKPGHTQTVVDEITILSVDKSAFPDIVVTFRAVDETGQVPTTLIKDNIDLFENNQPITDFSLSEGEIAPATIFFVIDRSYYSNMPNYNRRVLQQAISQLQRGGQFRDGVDTVAIYARVNNTQGPADSSGALTPGRPGNDKLEAVLGSTQSATVFTDATSNLDFSQTSGSTRELLSIDETLTNLTNLGVTKNGSTAIVFVASVIQWPSTSETVRNARELGNRARGEQTAVYTLHAHTEAQFADPLRTLADTSGGQYLLLSTDTAENTNGLNAIYSHIIQQGQTHTIRYRSTQSVSGTRTIALAPKNQPPSATTTYDLTLQPPTITITSPRDNYTVERQAADPSASTINLEPDTIPITAEISDWPDRLPRKIASVDFFVDGLLVLHKENPAETTFQLDLDISTFTQPKTLPVLVEVVDELGMKSSSSTVAITIEVDDSFSQSLAPTGSNEGTEIIVTREVNVYPCEENPDDPSCTTSVPKQISLIPWIVAGTLGVLLLAVTLFYRRRVAALAGNAGRAIRERAADVRKTILGGGSVRGKNVLAKLHVVNARRDLVGGEIKIYTTTTTLGRNPKLCDIQLYDEDDNSSVSGQHCTIVYDRGRFTLTDDNSANGTEINGQAIPPNEPTPLPDGAEIVLGDLFRRGAKLRFEMVQAAADGATGAAYSTPGAAAPFPAMPVDEGSWGDVTIVDNDLNPSRETLYDMDGEDIFTDNSSFGEFNPPKKDNDWLSELE